MTKICKLPDCEFPRIQAPSSTFSGAHVELPRLGAKHLNQPANCISDKKLVRLRLNGRAHTSSRNWTRNFNGCCAERARATATADYSWYTPLIVFSVQIYTFPVWCSPRPKVCYTQLLCCVCGTKRIKTLQWSVSVRSPLRYVLNL